MTDLTLDSLDYEEYKLWDELVWEDNLTEEEALVYIEALIE